MSSLTYLKLFQPTYLATTNTIVYTAPTSPAASVLKNLRVRLSNTSAAPASVTLYAVPNAASADNAHIFLSAVSIGVGASLEIDVPTLAAGDALSGFCSAANAVNIHEMGGVIYAP